MPIQAPVATFAGLASGLDTDGIIQKTLDYAKQPITNLQKTQATEGNKLGAWQQFNTLLLSVQTAAQSLTQASTFNASAGSSSNAAVATITAGIGSTVGDHTLVVNQLAQAQKVVSGTFTSGSTALGQSGAFTLNGKTITIGSADTLTDVAVKINNSGAGATASVVNVGPGDFRLTVSSQTSGTAGALSAADNGSGTVLANLGLVTGTAAIRQPVSGGGRNGAASLSLSSSTQAVATALGAGTGAAAGTVKIGGVNIAIDLNTDSLSSIADKINAAGASGVSAQVVSVPDANGNVSSSSKQQLQIVQSGATPPTFVDDNNVLSTLGVLQQGFAQQAVAATDARFNLDGLDLTRSSNVVSDVLPGSTIKLVSATPTGTPPAAPTATLSVSQDTATVAKSVQAFVDAYNAAQAFVTSQNKATGGQINDDGTTGNVSTSPLFGDTILNGIQSQLNQTLNAVAGSTTLQTVGITTKDDGSLSLDTGVLTSALQSNPSAVSSLFGLSGASTDSGVQFLGASTKTQATSGAGYSVNITQAATQAQGTADTAQTGASSAAETLSFGGALFASGVSLTIPRGSTLANTVAQINGDSRLSSQIYASVDASGKLSLAAKSYGSGKTFSATSNLPGGANNSGIGSTGLTVTAGVDVQGTINGEAATGTGQTLVGNAGNARTEGLKLLVTAQAAGALGKVSVTHGVADNLNNAVAQVTDPTNGDVIGAENALNAQISDAQEQIDSLQTRIDAYADYLRTTFSALEQRVAQLKSQGSAFTAQVDGLSNKK